MSAINKQDTENSAGPVKLRQKRWALFCLTAFAAIWLGGYSQDQFHWWKDRPRALMGDFGGYYTAALVLSSDTDRRLYSISERPDPGDESKTILINPMGAPLDPDSTYAKFDSVSHSEMQYVYPPFFAGTMIPLTYLGYENAKLVWRVLVFLFAAGAVLLVVRMMCGDSIGSLVVAILAVAALEASFPMKNLVMDANVSSLIMLLFVLGIYLHEKSPSASALFFAIAVMVKLTPLAVVPLFIIRKQWRWLGAFFGWSIALGIFGVVFFGLQNHIDFVTRVMPAVSDGVPVLDNRSLFSLISSFEFGRFLNFEEIYAGAYSNPAAWPGIVFRMLTVISYGTLVFYFWVKRRALRDFRIEMFLVALWILLFSPVTWRHGYVMAFAAILFAWLHPKSKDVSLVWQFVLLSATILTLSQLADFAGMFADTFPLEVFTFSLMPIGASLLGAYFFMLRGFRSATEPEAGLEPAYSGRERVEQA